jgi:hypothetical protein
MADMIVSPSLLEPLVKGSYEQLSGKINEAVSRDSENIFGTGTEKVRIIGTFKNHVIVVNEHAKFAKVMFEQTDTDQIVITGFNKLDIPVVESGDKLVEANSGLASKAIMEGSTDLARSLIHDMMRMSSGDRDQASKIKVNMYMNDLPSISETLDTVQKMGFESYKNEYEGKYTSLVLDPAYAMDHRVGEAVTQNLNNLLNNYYEMSEQTLALVAKMTKVTENDPTNAELKTFMESFADDVSKSHSAMATSMADVRSIQALGMLYDVSAERFQKQAHVFRQLSNAVGTIT